MAVTRDFKIDTQSGDISTVKPYGYETVHIECGKFGDEWDQTISLKQARDLQHALQRLLNEYDEAKKGGK